MEEANLNYISEWLSDKGKTLVGNIQHMAGDASTRRYFRVQLNGSSYIVMDASECPEVIQPYISIAKALQERSLLSPKIHKINPELGLVLISDFGDTRLLDMASEANFKKYYQKAIDNLQIIQNCHNVDFALPVFNKDFMIKELLNFQNWYIDKFLHLELTNDDKQILDSAYDLISELSSAQPKVFMHRDYHSANLMILADDRIGVLDFQDAFIGPVTYDLVSLLRDCYIKLPEDLVQYFVLEYKKQLNLQVSDSLFLIWFDYMGLQRHMKALLTFSRKYLQDGDSSYLKFIPATLNYISSTAKNYPELSKFYDLWNLKLLPAYKEVSMLCEG